MRTIAGARVQAGFTLLEMMIALAIFSLIGVGAYQLLSSTSALKERADARYRDLAQMQLAMRLMEDDFFQITPRRVVSTTGAYAPALRALPDTGAFELTRNGWRNPLASARSNLQRASWQLQEDRLLRTYWPLLDQRDAHTGVEREVASGIESIDFRFLDSRGKWHAQWPPAQTAPAAPDAAAMVQDLPQAVEIKLTHQRRGEVMRVIALR